MADQAERVILEAEDQVSPVVDKANAGLDSFEKKAESSHSKVIRISDQTRSSVQRLIASLEKQAETYGIVAFCTQDSTARRAQLLPARIGGSGRNRGLNRHEDQSALNRRGEGQGLAPD